MNIPRLSKIPKSLCVLSTGLLQGRWYNTSKYTVLCVASILKCFFTFAYFRTTTSLFTNALSVTHTQSGVHERPTFIHLHLLLLFLQPQWTSSLQLQPLLAWLFTLVAYDLLCRESSPNLWGQEGQSPHISSLITGPHHERLEWVEGLLILSLSSWTSTFGRHWPEA